MLESAGRRGEAKLRYCRLRRQSGACGAARRPTTPSTPLPLIERLLHWDTQLLLWINRSGTEPWDTICWYGTKAWIGIPLYAFLTGWIIWKERRRAPRILLLTGLAVGMADLTSARLLKPAIGRLRPSHEPALEGQLRLVHNYRGGRYGMPSNHAANTAAGAMMLSLQVRHPVVWVSAILWTVLHSFTRVYLGVHYPGDILGGWITGMVIACLLLRASRCVYA